MTLANTSFSICGYKFVFKNNTEDVSELYIPDDIMSTHRKDNLLLSKKVYINDVCPIGLTDGIYTIERSISIPMHTHMSDCDHRCFFIYFDIQVKMKTFSIWYVNEKSRTNRTSVLCSSPVDKMRLKYRKENKQLVDICDVDVFTMTNGIGDYMIYANCLQVKIINIGIKLYVFLESEINLIAEIAIYNKQGIVHVPLECNGGLPQPQPTMNNNTDRIDTKWNLSMLMNRRDNDTIKTTTYDNVIRSLTDLSFVSCYLFHPKLKSITFTFEFNNLVKSITIISLLKNKNGFFKEVQNILNCKFKDKDNNIMRGTCFY